MIIENKTKAVIVLKAVGLPNLRLFPGHNTVEEKGLKGYFESTAAKAHQKKNLFVADADGLTMAEKKSADKAKEKNDKLNKAQRVIKQQNETLAKNDETITAQGKLIFEQGKAIEDLMVKLEEIEAMLPVEPAEPAEPVKSGKGKEKAKK